MARLTRVHQKVFASNASNNGVFGSLQAGNPTTSNDVATLQSLSAFENGWDDAIEQGDKLPPLEEFQGVQYGISYQQAYMLQEGIAEWNTSTPYYKGSIVKVINGTEFKIYSSITDNNVGNIVTDTTNWKLVYDSSIGYADTNFSNLLSTAKNISNWSTNVTNCITEIPQDIKYTVSGGTVTFLAGSKIWYPNGSGTFSSYTLESNINHGFTGNKRLVCIDIDNKSSLSTDIQNCYSGSSQPSSTSGRRFWYDTTNNQIKAAESGSSSFSKKLSFPLLIQYGDGTNAYVDQVFNGFGYIGSTVFVLPNIKSLNPQGFNADGTLKSEVVTNNSVKTFTISNSNYGLVFGQSGQNWLFTSNTKAYFEQPTPPTTFDNGKALWFNTETNYFYRTENSGSTWIGPIAFTKYFSLYVDNNGKVTNFVPYHTFRSVNWADSGTFVGDYLSNVGRGNYRVSKRIFNGPHGSGNITLDEAYTNYDALIILYSSDNTSTWWGCDMVTVDELNRRRAAAPSGGSWFLVNGQIYWTCLGTSTTTSFLVNNENGYIHGIYGVKF